jgi:hypothetical protein
MDISTKNKKYFTKSSHNIYSLCNLYSSLYTLNRLESYYIGGKIVKRDAKFFLASLLLIDKITICKLFNT